MPETQEPFIGEAGKAVPAPAPRPILGSSTPDESYFKIASKLADLIRIAALSANDKWCASLLACHPLRSDIIAQPLKVVSGIRRATVAGELVRFDPHKGDSIAALIEVSRLVISEIEPFVIGVGKVRARQNEEGVIVISRDISERDFIDHSPPEIEITPEMIEAGTRWALDRYPEFSPGDAEIMAEGVLKATLAAPSGTPSSWRPISTAPYATRVLVWLYLPKNPPASDIVIAERVFVQKEDGPEYPEHERRTVGCWWANGRYYAAGPVKLWQPLPAPPEAT